MSRLMRIGTRTSRPTRVGALCLLVAGHLVVSSAQAGGPLDPVAELQAGDIAESRDQDGLVVHLNTAFGEVDNSEPPIKWPRTMRVEAGERLAVVVSDPTRPRSVELTFWKEIRKNGVPKRKVGHSECFTQETSVLTCELTPGTTRDGKSGWAVTFEPPTSGGHLYVAANFTWERSTTHQGAWIFHAKVQR